jgi:hypothetical protein
MKINKICSWKKVKVAEELELAAIFGLQVKDIYTIKIRSRIKPVSCRGVQHDSIISSISSFFIYNVA